MDAGVDVWLDAEVDVGWMLKRMLLDAEEDVGWMLKWMLVGC